MIFRQLFEPLSSTYTYPIGCPVTGQALLIDPVVNCIDRDLAALQAPGLTLALTVDTALHADPKPDSLLGGCRAWGRHAKRCQPSAPRSGPVPAVPPGRDRCS